jgi:mono/diheme cytochrome c family protein
VTVVVVPLLLVAAGCNGDFERMQSQSRYDLYARSGVFADGKAMQEAPSHTVAVEDEGERPTVDLALVQLGQDRFNIYCAACHGVLGDANTPVAAHMSLRQPPSLLEPRIVAFTIDRLYATITDGSGFMPSYAPQLDLRERWAVVAYVRALQRSQSTPLDALPRDVQAEARAALGGGQ